MRQRDIFFHDEGDAYFRRNDERWLAVTDAELAAENPPPLSLYRRFIRGGDHVLEIGCSSGLNLERIRLATGCRATGVDPSSAAVAAGRKRFPELELQVRAADALGFPEASFDFVNLGFCLYVVDRELLPRVVTEADRVLREGGYLGITDFLPDVPTRRAYHHREGVYTYKMDYSRLFTAFPHYVVVAQVSFGDANDTFEPDPQDRVAAHVLYKSYSQGYRI